MAVSLGLLGTEVAMRALWLIGAGWLVPQVALACPGKNCEDCAHADEAEAASDPAACAKKAELVGGSCSYSTGMMAQRVLSEGRPWTFTGTLVESGGRLDSHVAAPFVVGPEKVNVIANEVLESLTSSGAHGGRVGLEGRVLEVEGVKYFVVTRYRPENS